MLTFAHLADVHLGFQKEDVLFSKECSVFNNIMDDCIEKKVDFILMPGDIFHTNIPEMRVQKNAFTVLSKIKAAGIPVYVVYGSHDFSPVSNSVIDLLESSGLIIKMLHTADADGNIKLTYINGTKDSVLAGLSGLKVGKDIEWYEKLQQDDIPKGKRIFLFHGGIAEFAHLKMDGLMPSHMLPPDFGYYAGGHLHNFKTMSFPRRPNVTYPGTPFAGNTADIEENARGHRRGYVLVKWDINPIIEFIKVDNVRYELIGVDCNNKTMRMVNKELQDKLEYADTKNKIVYIKLYGKLTQDQTDDLDLDISLIREKTKDAMWCKIMRKFEKAAQSKIEAIGSMEEIEGEMLDEREQKLLQIFKMPQLENEKNLTYADRIEQEAVEYLGLGS